MKKSKKIEKIEPKNAKHFWDDPLSAEGARSPCSIIYINIKILVNYLKTKWDCFLTVQSMFFTIVTPGAGWISLVICIDRLICVFLPIKYLKLTSRYAYIIMFSGIACTIPTFILSGVASYEVREAYTVML